MQTEDFGVDAALAAVLAVPPTPRTVTDEQLLSDLAAWEAVGRVVDARRLRAAAEVEWRSRPQLGSDGIAERMGIGSGADLVADAARVTPWEAKRRIGLGTALLPRMGLTGEELPGRFPVIAAAVDAGEVGVDAARIVVETLHGTRRTAEPDDFRVAEQALTLDAGVLPPVVVRENAAHWAARLDQDGSRPEEERRRKNRTFRLGLPDQDGLTRFSGRATPDLAALLKSALQAHRRGVQMIQQAAGSDANEDLEGRWVEADGDQRTIGQFNHDTLAAIITAGVTAEHEGRIATRTVHEVLVHVTAEELEQHRGGGWSSGILSRLPIPTVERITCNGTTRLVVTGEGGEPLHLGRSTRLFTPAQKKALAARDGGCAWPGCTAPVAWTDAHHIAWWHRDGGPSDIDNGVLLCSHHHHLIHTTQQHEIRVHQRRPHLVPRGWHGPPLPRHRMHQHPITTLKNPPRRT